MPTFIKPFDKIWLFSLKDFLNSTFQSQQNFVCFILKLNKIFHNPQNAQLPSACAYLGSLVGTRTGNEFHFYLKMMVAHLRINDLI
jgi:hypothetical protein